MRVRFNDSDNLASCASFFAHAFPGDVVRNERTLELTFPGGSLNPAAQRQVIDRLLWAWRRENRIDNDDGFILPIDQDNAQLPAD